MKIDQTWPEKAQLHLEARWQPLQVYMHYYYTWAILEPTTQLRVILIGGINCTEEVQDVILMHQVKAAIVND